MIFRKEVAEARRLSAYGSTMIAVPFSFTIITLFLVVLLVGIVLFMVFISSSRIESVRGVVVPSHGIIRLTAPVSGILTSFPITEGAWVEKDQLIGRILRYDESNGSGSRMAAEEQALANQLDRLAVRLERIDRVSQLEMMGLEQNIGQLEQQISQLKESSELTQKLLEFSLQDYTRAEVLAGRNLMSDIELTSKNAVVIRAQQDHNLIVSQLESAEFELGGLNLRLEEVRARDQLLRQELQDEQASIRDQQDIQSVRQHFDIVAPVSGTTTALTTSQYANVNGGMDVVSLLPEGSKLQVELYVPSRAVGQLAAGQPVQISFESFPYQSFGTFGGEILSVTNSVIPSNSPSLLIPMDEPVFRVSVALEQDFVHKDGNQFELQPGMLLNANIVLERRRIISWVIEPVLSAFRRM